MSFIHKEWFQKILEWLPCCSVKVTENNDVHDDSIQEIQMTELYDPDTVISGVPRMRMYQPVITSTEGFEIINMPD